VTIQQARAPTAQALTLAQKLLCLLRGADESGWGDRTYRMFSL